MAAVLVAGLVGLTGCTGGSSEDPAPAPTRAGETTPALPSETPVSTEGVVATTTMLMDGQEIAVGIHPLVRAGEVVTLTVDLARDDAQTSVLANTLGATTPAARRGLRGVRLVDLGAGVVYEPAYDDEGHAVATTDALGLMSEGVSERRVQIAFAAPEPDVTELDLFWPSAPYTQDVPVLDGTPPPVPDSDVRYGTAVEDLAGADVFPLSSFSTDLEVPIDVSSDVEQVELSLGSDVLFDVDSSDLTTQAATALDSAAARIRERAGGEVLVIGHTDSVGADAHNLRLSRARAESVAEALGARVGSSYTFVTEGRGESDPVADNNTEAGRALNRRVALTLQTAEVARSEEAPAAVALPEFDGPSGAASEGVDVELSQGTVRVRVQEARLVDGHPVLDLEMTAAGEEGVSMVVGASLSGVDSPRGARRWTSHANLGAVRLVVDGRAFYPLDYSPWSDDENELWLPLTDLESRHEVADGEKVVFSVVYPRVASSGSVAIERLGSSAVQGFRLTDVAFAD